MAKKKAGKGAAGASERVYLFKDLAASLIATTPGLLVSADPDERARALRALADLAYVSSVVAGGEGVTAAELRDHVMDAERARGKK